MKMQLQLFEDFSIASETPAAAPGWWLSRLLLNPRSRLARQDLSNCHALHRTLMRAFPQTPPGAPAREQFGVLYRLEADERRSCLVLLVQSQVAPAWAQLPADRNGQPFCLVAPESKPIDDNVRALRDGRRLVFRLRANPTQCKSSGKQSGRRGKPLAVFGAENQLAWLHRQGAAGGFRVDSARVRPDLSSFAARAPHASVSWQQGRKKAGAKSLALTFGAVVFEGVLTVTDAGTFRDTLAKGVGRGKAYGFGLLSVAPAA
jgi:CRISPR system Cascade subunit CasE